MAFIRLSTVAPDITRALETQSIEVLGLVAQSAALWTVRQLALDDPRISAATNALLSGERGDSKVRQAVKALADELDEAAWEIQDRIESGDASEEAYSQMFCRSRAATALWYALDTTDLTAALETVYEAQAATDPDSIRKVVYAVIDGRFADE